MLRSLDELRGYTIVGTDGDCGDAKDFLFDDVHWIVRYVVVDTGKWLPGRKVLISPFAVQDTDWAKRKISVSLSREQIEKSPGLDVDEPVSRQKEQELIDYYGWKPYWAPGGVVGGAPVPPVPSREAVAQSETEGNLCLRSAHEVNGYHIHARDGEIGHVADFIADIPSWQIRYMVVDTRNWLPGRKVLVSPLWTDNVKWADREVQVDMTQEEIKNSPKFAAGAPVNREYETRLYDYYGRPAYWE
jgi:hypothetical protein